MVSAGSEAGETPDSALDPRVEVEHLREERILLWQALEEARNRLERAEAANRAKDDFLATLSHELRTPLNAMLGWAQMLIKEDLDEPTRLRAIQSIERNTKLQAQLIDDLLDLSRINTGKLKVERVPLHVIPVIAAAVDGFKQQAQDKGLELDLEIWPIDDLINGDVHRVQQIIGNLLGNALKFTPKGGRILVQVDSGPQGESTAELGRGRVRIRVIDTGKGIDPQTLAHIFERFWQGDSSTTKTHGGLGLGLAVARHLSERHGGTIRAQSDGDGRGSTFTVELPTLNGTERRSRRESSVPPSEESRLRPQQLQGVSVLVVDDEPDARELIATMLLQYGAQVVQASSVDEAFTLFSDVAPDVLVSDIAMPAKDGYELIRRVRVLDRERSKQTPAIALTAYATRQDRDRALRAGFDRHLAKPIDAGDLVGTVAQLTFERL